MGWPDTGTVPAVLLHQETLLPMVARHFDSLWVFDHLYGFGEPSYPYLESWTTLTWLAARFPELQLGTLVLGVGLRNPALLAKMAATLQTLSGGRFVLGLGAGWREEEYRAYGFPFPTAVERIAQLDEGVTVIRRMWTEPAPTFTGHYYSIHDAYCEPRPAPPPPIMIGGEGEKRMLPLIARQADWWNTGLWDATMYRTKRDLLYREAEAMGRDPSSIVLTMEHMGGRLPETASDSRRWLEELQPLIELGVTHFMFDFGNPLSPEPVERFAGEVIAPVNAEMGVTR
jgi:alkanesulfonate monooxygenase SsuD/methylene tetrahydromethanopterin reductase-like flavin-dependent oxidoreductase (luciferase family)